MESSKCLFLILILCAAVYLNYKQIEYKEASIEDNLTFVTIEQRLIAEISDLAGYHFRRELEINKSWEQKLLSHSAPTDTSVS